MRLVLMAGMAALVLSSAAAAQTPAAGALDAPARAKVAAPPAPPVTKAGDGGGTPGQTDLSRALADGELFRSAELGATSSQLIRALQAKRPTISEFDPEKAAIAVAPDGSYWITQGGPANSGPLQQGLPPGTITVRPEKAN